MNEALWDTMKLGIVGDLSNYAAQRTQFEGFHTKCKVFYPVALQNLGSCYLELLLDVWTTTPRILHQIMPL